MEARTYFQILRRKWWVVVAVFLIMFAATIIFTLTQAPTFRATATFVVAPIGSFGNVSNFANGLDILSRRAEIASTYAEVAISRLIKHEAAKTLNLSAATEKNLIVKSKLRSGTNVIEISVEGNNAVLVADFANRVGDGAVVYAQQLYEAYNMKALDLAVPPVAPVRPNKSMNLGLGAILGLALGCGLAFLYDYLQAPLNA